MGTDLTLMEPGTQFTGRIHFRNLSKDELGLLLWCLTLDDGLEEDKTYFQTVGKGKPWGYGRMKVTLDAVEQLCPERLYRADGLASGKYTQPLDAQRADRVLLRLYGAGAEPQEAVPRDRRDPGLPAHALRGAEARRRSIPDAGGVQEPEAVHAHRPGRTEAGKGDGRGGGSGHRVPPEKGRVGGDGLDGDHETHPGVQTTLPRLDAAAGSIREHNAPAPFKYRAEQVRPPAGLRYVFEKRSGAD